MSFPQGEFGGISEPGSALYRHDTPARSASEDDPVSTQASDLTRGGVEHARKVAKTEILRTIDGAPAGAVLFIGGKSDQPRSEQTAEIWGEALQEVATGRDDIIVLTKTDIDQQRAEMIQGHSETNIISEIKKLIDENPDKKVVVDYPLFIKQFGYSYKDRWTRENPDTGKAEKTEYFSEILNKHHQNHAESIHDWLENDGVLTLENGQTLNGPRPENVAKEYLHGLQRLYAFVKAQTPNRPVLVHAVGHQWDLDAVATYLARGKVTYKDWYEIMGRQNEGSNSQVIGEGEGVHNILIDPKSGGMSVEYRDQKFTYNPEDGA